MACLQVGSTRQVNVLRLRFACGRFLWRLSVGACCGFSSWLKVDKHCIEASNHSTWQHEEPTSDELVHVLILGVSLEHPIQ